MTTSSTIELPPELSSQRTVLVPLTFARAELIYRYYQENLQHLFQWDSEPDANAYSLEVWQAYAEWSQQQYENGQQLEFIALDKEKNEMLALCSFTAMTKAPTYSCDIGFSIALKHQGQGLMFEVLQRLIAYLFDEKKMHRIVARYHPDNQRSQSLLETLCFEREGRAKAYLKINAVWCDHIVMALINPKF